MTVTAFIAGQFGELNMLIFGSVDVLAGGLDHVDGIRLQSSVVQFGSLGFGGTIPSRQ
jgi:hypothetical protein